MLLYRLTRPNYAPGLDGEGARRAGGRWNSPGWRAVYCASSVSLAAHEVFVHLPPSMRRPGKLPEMSLVSIKLPDDVGIETVDLADFRVSPSPADSRRRGDIWLMNGAALVLSVPSLVIPMERNYILNAGHPGLKDVEDIAIQPFLYDPRIAMADDQD